MKAFKVILAALAIFFVIFMAIGFLLPAHVDVERSVLIHAKPEQIHVFIDDLKRWTEWTPWNQELDPTVIYTYSGSEKGESAQMDWKAEKMGSGHLILTRSDPTTGVWYTINFGDGMQSQGTIVYESQGDNTRVIWRDGFDLGHNPINRYFGLLMDSMLGHDFEKGLAKLKLVVEKSPN